ncbi:oligosaccharide flippase family protein [Candidatus Woesearchaeota archaeon]|nr:oligosaccharide flippase family protein [Candidatus Woesearchaeota archaeon]
MSAARGAVYLTIANAVFLIASYALYLILGRTLDIESFGRFGIIIAITSIIDLVLMFGMIQATSHFVAASPDNVEGVKRAALRLQLCAAGIAFAVFLALAYPLSLVFRDELLLGPLLLVSPLIIVQAAFSVYEGVLNGQRRFRDHALFITFYSLARLALVVGLVKSGFGISGAVVGMVLASVLSTGFIVPLTGRMQQSENVPWKPLLNYAVPICFYMIATHTALNIDLFFLKALTPAINAGYYTAAQTMSRIPYYATMALSMVAFPLVSASIASKDVARTNRYIRKSLLYTLAAAGFIASMVSATAPALAALAYGEAYVQAAISLRILAAGMGLFALLYIMTTIINAKHPKAAVRVMVVVLAVSVALNAVLVPRYGAFGAALSTASAMFLGVVLAGMVLSHRHGVLLGFGSLAKAAVATGAVYAIASIVPVKGFMLLAEYVLLGIIYVCILAVTKFFDSYDWRMLRNI